MSSSLPPLQLCVISDGKAGHDTQLQGLQSGLARHFQITSERIETGLGFVACVQALKHWSGQHRDQTSLVAGAGSRSWRYLIVAKKILGLHTLVLQKPRWWPYAWFDHVVVPYHDGVKQGGHIICTEGVLNPMQPAVAPNPNKGLILIGGPSKHYNWADEDLLEQIQFVVNTAGGKQWYLTTSRRTPSAFLSKLQALGLPKLNIVPVESTLPNWVAEQLQQNAVVWVTEDSMSMVFEGLSAGVQVGLLSLPRRREGRVTGCIDNLVRRRWVTPFGQYKKDRTLVPVIPALQEAARVADLIAPQLKKRYAQLP